MKMTLNMNSKENFSGNDTSPIAQGVLMRYSPNIGGIERQPHFFEENNKSFTYQSLQLSTAPLSTTIVHIFLQFHICNKFSTLTEEESEVTEPKHSLAVFVNWVTVSGMCMRNMDDEWL